MRTFEIGELVGVQCEVMPGPFSEEKIVSIDTTEGPITGFVRESELRQTGNQWYVRGKVESVSNDALEVWIRGSFLTTNGLASVPQHLAMAA